MKVEKIIWKTQHHELKCTMCDGSGEYIAKISAPDLPDLFNLVVCGVCAEKTEGELLKRIKGGQNEKDSL